MRKKIAAGNWKMNKTLAEGKQLIADILNGLKADAPKQDANELLVILGTPFITLRDGVEMVNGNSQVQIAAQNCYSEENGAYTGETSVEMIKSTGAGYVIIGHSERREYFNESYEMLTKKVDLTLKHGLSPIFCCGEKLETREKNQHFYLVKQQITNSLFHLDAAGFGKIVIAYEPVWAIGTGVTASPEQAQEMHAFIRKLIVDKYGTAVANETSILYGGSVNAKNASILFGQTDVDGGLVGGASLKADDFVTIINSF
ncbi:MAG: triose-phosphate isomerase [Bacteroidetes bacterium 4484_276]|nr:MAG: triose-phosphate isomerase [Bacteroidetes bacterium 4484_276]